MQDAEYQGEINIFLKEKNESVHMVWNLACQLWSPFDTRKYSSQKIWHTPSPRFYKKYDENVAWIYMDFSTEYCDDKLVRVTSPMFIEDYTGIIHIDD